MTPRGSADPPRITRATSLLASRVLLGLLILAVFAGSIFGAFFAGIHLERQVSKPLFATLNAVEQERDALSAQVADLKQKSIVLERSQQFDRKVYRTVSEQLQKAQDERLAVEKEASFLRRLIQEGGGGILQAKDFELKATGEPREFSYSFTVSQLIQDFGESAGSVEIKLVGMQDGQAIILPLGKLSGSQPKSHKMKFKHFQSFQGSIMVPDGVELENLVVEIKPKTAKLIPVSETFPWSIE